MIVDPRQQEDKDKRTTVVLFDLACNVYVNGPLQEGSDQSRPMRGTRHQHLAANS